MVIVDETLEAAKMKLARVSKKHGEYLRSIGLVVNESKTEAVVFTKKKSDRITTEVDICGTIIKTTDQMKVLGVIFDSSLTWGPHIRSILKKCNSKLGVLKRIRKRFTKDQFLQIVTTQYYSQLYYCSAVWLGDSTLSALKKCINSAHYRPLRKALKDYTYKNSRVDLSNICRRATPSEWFKYTVSSLAIKTITQREPFFLYSYLSVNVLHKAKAIDWPVLRQFEGQDRQAKIQQ